ncbi:MAG: TetR/AcrR family transcriptional regulator [Chloroflexi bacterium]|nr:TetR/AcrR family transcriptional regulator [Chloroflexota bacterium]
MKKSDRRVLRTKRALGDALISLSLEKGYDHFTIRDLTERADVGYATFYRHYKSKDQLLNQCLRDIYQKLECEVRQQETIFEECLAMFNIVAEHKEACLLGVNLLQDHPALKPLREEISQMVNELCEAQDEMTIPLEVAINHLIGSVLEMIRWWLTEGQDYSPEQMATMQSELIVNVTETVALKHRVKSSRNIAPD